MHLLLTLTGFGARSLVVVAKVCIGISVHELVQLSAIADGDFEKPAIVIGAGIHRFRSIQQGLIDLGDFAAQRAVDVGCCFHRLYTATSSLAFTVAPSSGSSTNTMSPSAS